MIIVKSLLKYGYSNFKLEILEYCSRDTVISREQYYLDLLSPEYNILDKAGSSAGYKHTEEALAKVRSYLAKMNAEKGIKVGVLDIETNITTTYDSIRKAAEALGCAKYTIQFYEKQQLKTGVVKAFKGRYIISVVRVE
jgi:hypothetical protein